MKEQQIYTGVIRTIGAGVTSSGNATTETRVSVFEIGDEVLENVAYDSYTNTYLSRAFESGEVVSIAVVKFGVGGWKFIFAIKMGGKMYISKFMRAGLSRLSPMQMGFVPSGGLLGLIIAGSVFGVVGFFVALIGGIFGIVYLARKNKSVVDDVLAELERA